MSAHNIADLRDDQKVNPNQLREKLNKEKVLVVDVRNVQERKDNGFIERSINIPFPELENALKLSKEVFKEQYGADQPSAGEQVVFHCQHGGRGSRAVLVANKLGINNSQNLVGGYSKYAEEK